MRVALPLNSVVFEHMSKTDTRGNRKYATFDNFFFFDKSENASQKSVYRPDTVTAQQIQFWLRRFRASDFDVFQ